MSRPLLVGVAVLALAGEAGGASFVLSEVERRTAIQLGERSITAADDFDREWRVTNGGGETAAVLTPFHRLALAARNAAFKNEPLAPADVQRLLRQDAGRLVVWVTLRGASEDFARHYLPVLLIGTREIKPSFVQNERTALPQPDGGFLARCLYGFPVKDVDGRARVGLTVADLNGRAVSRFTIDLSGMR